MEYIQFKKYGRIPRLAFKVRHPSTSRWFWPFQKDLYAILLTRLCYYFTSPGLAWDAMLKMTDIKLELITDMFQFIEKGMGGSISYIGNR